MKLQDRIAELKPRTTMKLSEIGLMQPVLCKKAGTTWSEIFEIMKLGYSATGRAVYVRVTFGMQGQDTHSQHYWRDVVDLDAKWEVFDTLSPDTEAKGPRSGPA